MPPHSAEAGPRLPKEFLTVAGNCHRVACFHCQTSFHVGVYAMSHIALFRSLAIHRLLGYLGFVRSKPEPRAPNDPTALTLWDEPAIPRARSARHI